VITSGPIPDAPTPKIHDVGVTGIVCPLTAIHGDVVNIVVNIVNFGTKSETVNITVSYDDNQISHYVNVSLESKQSISLENSWNTANLELSTYRISVEATIYERDEYGGNNILQHYIDVVARPSELKILASNLSAFVFYQEELVFTSASIRNSGDYEETFDIYLYANSSLVNKNTISSLQPGEETTTIITWNTTGVQPGSYDLRVEIEELANEGNPEDNAMEVGTIQMLEDVNPPSLTGVEYTPHAPDYDESVRVSASIVDGETEVETATLYYGEGFSWKSLTMVPQGENYVALIPAFHYGANMQFKVSASDLGGNQRESEVYEYTVGDTSSPIIESVGTETETPTAMQEVEVTVYASEPENASGVKDITLMYREFRLTLFFYQQVHSALK